LREPLGSDAIAINLGQCFPLEPGGILDGCYLRLGRAVEHNIQPVLITQALSRFVLVGRERYFPYSGSPFHFDEPCFDLLARRIGGEAA
jgi:hypothetical protein